MLPPSTRTFEFWKSERIAPVLVLLPSDLFVLTKRVRKVIPRLTLCHGIFITKFLDDGGQDFFVKLFECFLFGHVFMFPFMLCRRKFGNHFFQSGKVLLPQLLNVNALNRNHRKVFIQL
jgi:hypothetical protein